MSHKEKKLIIFALILFALICMQTAYTVQLRRSPGPFQELNTDGTDATLYGNRVLIYFTKSPTERQVEAIKKLYDKGFLVEISCED